MIRKLRFIQLLSFFLAFHFACCYDSERLRDVEGNEYRTIKIGNQIWMAENLRVTRFRNGDLIPNIKNNEQWKFFPSAAYSNYFNKAHVSKGYGYLYNWFAVNDSRNIAPKGWHVPTDQEVREMINFLGIEKVGGKLKDSGLENWLPPNKNSTNESKFTALPSGYRSSVDGYFHSRKNNGYWWSTTSSYGFMSWTDYLHLGFADVTRNHNDKMNGFAIRCIKNSE